MPWSRAFVLGIVAVSTLSVATAWATVIEDFNAGLDAWQVNPAGGTVEVAWTGQPAFASGGYLAMSAEGSALPVLFRTFLADQDGLVLQFGGEASFTNPSAYSQAAVTVSGLEPQNFGPVGEALVGGSGFYSIPLGLAGLYMVQIGLDTGGQAGQSAVAAFDTFSLVPEPAALVVLLVGALGLLRHRRWA